MLVAQISDFHVVEQGRVAYGRVDTGSFLERAIDSLVALRPQPNIVVGTGDLVQSGSEAEYARLRRILKCLPMPFAPVAGNHDHRASLRWAFANNGIAFGPEPFAQYAMDLGDIRLVVADTVTPGSDEPSFCSARAEGLERILAESNKPTLLAMHHPPFASGIDWLEPADPNWQALLAEVLQQAPQVVRIIAGHVHRAIHSDWLGIPASTAPSTAHQVFPDLTGGPPILSLEAPGFQLHRWDGNRITTYTISTAGFGETFSPSQERAG